MLGNAELFVAIDDERVDATCLIYLVVFPKAVTEECLKYIVLLESAWVEAIHEV